MACGPRLGPNRSVGHTPNLSPPEGFHDDGSVTPAMDDDEPRSVAIEQLEALGLSSYAARTFVALVVHGDATAEEVSQVADVPRTRVYDAADELAGWGLVDVDQSKPRRFSPVSVDRASRRFEAEYARRREALLDALSEL